MSFSSLECHLSAQCHRQQTPRTDLIPVAFQFWLSSEQCNWCLSSAVPMHLCPHSLQEKRMSKATEVMMQYVENLKRTYEKDHAELMEFKKLANQNSSRSCGPSGKNPASVLVVRPGPPWLGPQGSGQLRGCTWLVETPLPLPRATHGAFTAAAPVRMRFWNQKHKRNQKFPNSDS